MIETIKSIILDFQEVILETGVPRRIQIEVVPGKAPYQRRRGFSYRRRLRNTGKPGVFPK